MWTVNRSVVHRIHQLPVNETLDHAYCSVQTKDMGSYALDLIDVITIIGTFASIAGLVVTLRTTRDK
ncbi:hypothetical protein RUM4293_00447 [Ruegeria atlantica]|uniref:Uncharacterized protein n=1 Tax=Ruegeria atlantica TaxID=81569 RepID=A0A0P1EK79_9RHOB|nr:hypothetical protein RUM4293_00447 [Ruegeria atlantica]